MAHPRKLIRYAIVNILKAANICGGRVYPNRPLPGWEEEFPYICVYSTDETAENDTQPVNYERKPKIRVEIVDGIHQEYEGVMTKINKSLDDDMDDIAEAVEDAILAVANPPIEDPISGRNLPAVLVDPVTGLDTADALELGATSQKLIADGDQILGSTTIDFHPTYHSRFNPPEADDFGTAKVDIDSNRDGTPDLTAEQVLQEETYEGVEP
jgi:hypothetical protein